MQHPAAREHGAIRGAAGWPPRRLCQIGIALALTSAAGAQAGEQCDPALAQSIRTVQSNVESLRAGKSDLVALKLRLIGEACAHGRDLEAAWRLEQLQDQLIASRNAARASCQATSRSAFTCNLSADAAVGRRTINVDPTPSRLSAITSP